MPSTQSPAPTVQDYLAFSQYAYQAGSVVIPAGFSLLGPPISTPGGLNAVVFIDRVTKQIVIAFRGTDVSNAQDLQSDYAIWKDRLPQAFTDAAVLVATLRNNRAYAGYTLDVTGHSLGGAEAEYVAGQFTLGGATFAAPGILQLPGVRGSAPGLTDYELSTDLIGNYGSAADHIGTVVELKPHTYLGELASGDFGNLIMFAATTHELYAYAQSLVGAGIVAANPLKLPDVSLIDLTEVFTNIKNLVFGTNSSGAYESGSVTEHTTIGNATETVKETVSAAGVTSFALTETSGHYVASEADTISANGSVTADTLTFAGMTIKLAPSIGDVSVAQDGSLVAYVGNPATGINENIVEHPDGSLTFYDAFGTIFANYPAGALTGNSIKVVGTQIETVNSSGQVQNLTFADTSNNQVSLIDLGPISPTEFDLNGAQSNTAVSFSITGTAGSSVALVGAHTANVSPPGINVANPGTIVVTAGTGSDTLVISGDFSSSLSGGGDIQFIGGSGSDTIDASAMTSHTVVEVLAGTGADTVLMGPSETLKLDNPTHFTGTISNFAAGNTIDLAGIAATGATLGANNVLTVQESGGGSVTLHLAPTQNYAGDLFETSPDADGGTDIGIATLAITPANPTVNENAGSEIFTVTRSGDIAAAATVYVSTTDGSAVSGESINSGDFTALSYQPVTFEAGATSATVSVTVNDLHITGGASKNFGLAVTDGISATANVLATDHFTIVDNDISAGRHAGRPRHAGRGFEWKPTRSTTPVKLSAIRPPAAVLNMPFCGRTAR